MKNSIRLLLAFSFAGWSLIAGGQTYQLSDTETTITVKGTSSLHDWEMQLDAFASAFHLNRDGSVLKGFDNVTFSCKATDIKSEYSLMDKKAYDAMKADKFPEIQFSGISSSGINSNGKEFNGNLMGTLHVAGESQDVTIPFKGTFTNDNAIYIVASADLLMSSFNITPPTAMMGALKTGDQITVSLSLHFKNNENRMMSSNETR